MDRREAIDILVGVIATNSEEENEALDLAIEALQESATTTDCVSRQAAIEAVKTVFCEMTPFGKKNTLIDILNHLPPATLQNISKPNNLPPVNQKQVTGKLKNPDDSLLKPDSDECKEQKSKLDCISRQQAIEVLHKYFIDAIDKTPHEIDEDGDDVYTNMKAVNELLKHNKHISKAIKALPPVTPTDKVVDFNNMISADDRIRNLPPVTPQVKVQQADTLIIATALRDFAQDSERNISDRERAEELREQVLAYGASMCHVTPTERTGEWEEVQGCKSYLCCSECGRFVNVAHKCNFCPNCGADMRGDTE